MFISDKFSKTINIPVHIVNGKIEYYYEDGLIPEIKDGTICELIVPAYSLKDKKLREKLSQEKRMKLLDKGHKLYVHMSYKDSPVINKELNQYLDSAIKLFGRKDEGFFVEVILEEELQLQFRASKKSRLLPCKCSSPILGKVQAVSLNQIYTLISELFEPRRNSHSGNVFSKVFFQRDDKYLKLDILRQKKEVDYEKEVLLSKEEDK